jgi:hypothetical protein
LGLLFLLAREVPPAVPFELHRSYSPLADNTFIHWLAASASGLQAVRVGGMAAAVAFTIGWWTSSAYTLLVAAILLTRLALLHSSGQHDWVCPMAILLALLAVPWGEGVGVDRWRRPTGAADVPDARYGFALFAPGLVMGLAFAAAAYAKLTVGGLAWVTGGAVRYHFVEDAENAATTWGLWVAAHPAVAVLASAGAVGLEATWIAAVCLRRPGPRLLAAGAALSLFLGFYAFQGALWAPWIMWTAAYLPWDGWKRLPSMPLAGSRAALAGAVLAVQLVASLRPLEVEPLMSPYQMYSGTYASTADFERRRHRKFQRVQLHVDGRTLDVGGDAADSLSAAVGGAALDEEARQELDAACAGATSPSVEVEVAKARIDWTAPRVTQTWVTTDRSFACR